MFTTIVAQSNRCKIELYPVLRPQRAIRRSLPGASFLRSSGFDCPMMMSKFLLTGHAGFPCSNSEYSIGP
jgi:hypothetical protein